MKASSTLIKQCVERARKYLSDIKELREKIGVYQADISEMALRICDIRHGGISTDIYTIRDFASDIGMNGKTLQNWVAAYRIVVPVIGRENITTQKDWTNVRKTRRSLNGNESPENITKMFTLYNNNNKPFIGEYLNAVANVKNLKYMLGDRDKSTVTHQQWSNLMRELDICSDMINDYLTKG